MFPVWMKRHAAFKGALVRKKAHKTDNKRLQNSRCGKHEQVPPAFQGKISRGNKVKIRTLPVIIERRGEHVINDSSSWN